MRWSYRIGRIAGTDIKVHVTFLLLVGLWAVRGYDEGGTGGAVAAALALIAQLAVLWSVIAGRAPASTPGRSARLAEIGWVVLPTIVLIAILVLTWNRLGEPVAIAPLAGVRA